jgi:hypothetical protein
MQTLQRWNMKVVRYMEEMGSRSLSMQIPLMRLHLVEMVNSWDMVVFVIQVRLDRLDDDVVCTFYG